MTWRRAGRGRCPATPEPWTLPRAGQPLRVQALRAQIVRWVDQGIIEPGAGRALQRCLDHPEWFDLSDRCLVLLGAGSEAGPLAWLATPTDAFAVPLATAEAARQAWSRRPLSRRVAQAMWRAVSGGRLFQPNVPALHHTDEGQRCGIVDSLIPEQGPNDALAKRLQQWRAVLARQQGLRVSLNVAPSTLTASVLQNKAFAAAFAGAPAFGVEPFEPATTTALMAALWVHDLRCDEAAGNPARQLAHPYELFMDSACHGGLWRSAYQARSALPVSALSSLLRRPGG